MPVESLQIVIPDSSRGERFDRALAQLFPQYSRSLLKQWIDAGVVWVDGQCIPGKQRVNGGESVKIAVPAPSVEVHSAPEAIALDIVHEDGDLVVLNKPAGLVVHPAAGHANGTLLNGLLYRFPELEHLPRAGIVHRLDRDTTGLMVVARTREAHKQLVDQLQERSVKREYLALVYGEVVSGGTIDKPVGRHPVDRKKMAVVESGKQAITHYRIERRFERFTLLSVRLETGRTHQIRVHMQSRQYPIVGDPVYGKRLMVPAGVSERCRHVLQSFRRQALHARRLRVVHPGTGEPVQWSTDLPPDFRELIEAIDAG